MLITTEIAITIAIAVVATTAVRALVRYVKNAPARLAAWQEATGLECRYCKDSGVLQDQGGDRQGCFCGRGSNDRKAERVPPLPLTGGVLRPHLLGTLPQPTAAGR